LGASTVNGNALVNEPNPAAQKPAQKRRQHEHAYWEALRARAYALRAEGKTHEQIAAELGTALSTVSRWLRQPVVSAYVARHRRIHELARAGWSNAAIAAEVGMRADSVRKIRARCAEATAGGRPDPAAPLGVLDRAARRARIVALSEAGRNNSQIARQIGVTPAAVCRMLARARRQSKAAAVKGGEIAP